MLLGQRYKQEHLDVPSINILLSKKKIDFHRLSFAIGAHDFSEITEPGKDFVDKSLFIKEIIETGDKVTIITRPRRWGKTTNMDMLSKFFAIEVNETDDSIVKSRYRELFQRLRIGQKYSKLVEEHQGQYPVIFFSFKNLKSNNLEIIKSKLIGDIKILYKQYKYLYSSDKIDDDQKNELRKYENGNIGESQIESSLGYLSSLLKTHHGKKVYTFIDEYDVPLHATYDSKDYEKTLKLIRAILGEALKDNDNLLKGVVTGVTNIAKAGLFSHANNPREYSILKSRYAEHFGFTEEEVSELLEKANITDTRILSTVKEFYNGYQIGGYTMYNPWSIVSFLTDLELAPYWVNTEGSIAGANKLSAVLLMTTQMQSTVRELIRKYQAKNKETVEIVINPEVVLHKLNESPQAIWTVLAYGGYLDLINRSINNDLTETCSARIPNREVLGIYIQSILLWFKDLLGINLNDLLGRSTVLNIEDIKEFETLVKKVLLLRKDILGDVNESLFHSLIDGIFLFGGTTHQLSREIIAGPGRIGSIFHPIDGKSIKTIIHEYKLLGKTKSALIDSKIQEALWQVYEHYYFEDVVSKYREFEYSHYQQLEIRGIVAFIDENTNDLGMRSSAILHNMSDVSELILPLFKSLNEKDLRKLKTYFRLDEFIKEFQRVGSVQTILEQLESSDDHIIYEIGKTVGNSALAKRLWSEHGDTLRTMSQQELKKLKGVGPKRAKKIEELGFSYKTSTTDSKSK